MKHIVIFGIIWSLSAGAKKPQKTNNVASAKGDDNFRRGIVTSPQVEFGIMTTIRGRVSVARFYDKSLKKVCYVSLKHATDDIQAISCVPHEE